MQDKKWKKRIMKAGTIIVVAAAAMGGILYIENRPKELSAIELQEEKIMETLSVTGDIKSNESTTYYAMFTAPIEVLQVKVGDEVRTGEKLVSFDVKDLTLEAKQSALAVTKAAQQYQSTVDQNEKNTLIYQGAAMNEAAFAALIEGQRDVIKELQSKVTKAADKQNDIAVLQNRVNMEVDEDDKEDLQKTLDEWKGEYQNYKVPQITAELVKQQSILTDMETYRSQYEAQKESADNRLIDADAQKEILTNKQSLALLQQDDEADLNEAIEGIAADYNGIISKVYVEEGATVNQGTPILTVEDSDQMAVDAMVSKYDIAKVEMGQKAIVSVAEHTYQGTVTKIGRVATKDASDKAKIPVTVSIQKSDSSLYVGLEADVEIEIAKKKNAKVIPIEAVYTDDEGSYCYCIENERIVIHRIETGLQSEEKEEVVSGLQAGEMVITDAVTESETGKRAIGKEQTNG